MPGRGNIASEEFCSPFVVLAAMFPTAARLSKASRAPLTPKRGNKDFYKGLLSSLPIALY
jgi:hypothetical protein